MGASQSSSRIGMFYQIESSEKFIYKKVVGFDNIYHICSRQSLTKKDGTYFYKIIAEVEGIEFVLQAIKILNE